MYNAAQGPPALPVTSPYELIALRKQMQVSKSPEAWRGWTSEEIICCDTRQGCNPILYCKLRAEKQHRHANEVILGFEPLQGSLCISGASHRLKPRALRHQLSRLY